jgi:primosomal protein N' (replication factor Y)
MSFADIAVPAPFYPSDTVFTYRIPESLEESLSVGSLVKVSFGKRLSWGVVTHIHHAPLKEGIKTKDVDSLILPEPIFSEKRLRFLQSLSAHYVYPIGLVMESAIPTPLRNGSPRTLRYTVPELLPALRIEPSATQLNDEQRTAVKSISQKKGVHLLWGLTGSGKTEVYLKLIEEVLERGEGALVLVPEISLTPLLTERFEKRFPDQVALFHSAQSPKKIREAWFEVWTGQKRIALGARSALFAPLKNPGIVVVDEEHDGSYKQEEGFRYNARDAAIRFAKHFSCTCVLGSATPSAEALALVDSGEASVSVLRKRAVESASLPKLSLIDLRLNLPQEIKIPHVEIKDRFEAPRAPGDFFLSPQLQLAIDETLKAKEQCILFINRRGVGSQKLCRSCGFVHECPNCAVKLTPHSHHLACHYCGYSIIEPDHCPSCSSPHPFLQVGTGTEGVEEALSLHFPSARVLRMDRDTIANKNDLEKTLNAFSSGEADILVGTQMVAKGHDFPKVTLVGILLADMGMNVPDFRANERSLQLLMQVSGRAGRSKSPGRVLVQTFQPEHPVFQHLQAEDPMESYKRFLSEEMIKRKLLNYPPYASLALLRLDGLVEDRVQEASRFVAHTLNRAKAPGLQVLGPTPSPISKLRGRHRRQILIKSQSKEVFEQTLHWLLQGWNKGHCEKKYKTRLLVDVDPVQMM